MSSPYMDPEHHTSEQLHISEKSLSHEAQFTSPDVEFAKKIGAPATYAARMATNDQPPVLPKDQEW